MIITGKGGISADLVAHSRWQGAEPVCTFVLVYPHIIHGQMMSHKTFSRNAASSRAVPSNRLLEQVIDKPYIPFALGINQSGMQPAGYWGPEDNEYHQGLEIIEEMRQNAIKCVKSLTALGVHKEDANRYIEPFVMMYTVYTMTEPYLNNFFNLRLDHDEKGHPIAQLAIKELARLMDQAIIHSAPRELRDGEWHMPFVDWFRDGGEGRQVFMDENGSVIPLDLARKISVSMAAQSSFRRSDASVEKAVSIDQKLNMPDIVHGSPFEHVAQAKSPEPGQESNLVGWTQYRKLIPNEFNPKWRN